MEAGVVVCGTHDVTKTTVFCVVSGFFNDYDTSDTYRTVPRRRSHYRYRPFTQSFLVFTVKVPSLI